MSSTDEAPAIKVTVVDVAGSAPREAGTSMLVYETAIAGTIGGGALEWRAIGHAREMLAGEDLPEFLDLPLGPALGQCCGGRVRLAFERNSFEPTPTGSAFEPHVHIYGAGHVGAALTNALLPLPFALSLHDCRQELLSRFDSCGPALFGNYDVASSVDDFHLVMTHSHAIDLHIVGDILACDGFAFLGLIGSASKRARFGSALRARGLGQSLIDRIDCPIGIAGIDGKEPTVIAASVAAQLLRARQVQSLRRRNKQLVTPPE